MTLNRMRGIDNGCMDQNAHNILVYTVVKTDTDTQMTQNI